MSATDERGTESGYPHTLRPELHRALDAAGIDYWVAQGITFWNRDDGCECLAYGFQANGVPKLAIKVVGFTDPEQAIAATLGTKRDRIEEWLLNACNQAAADYIAELERKLEAAMLGSVDKGIPQGADGNLDQSQVDWLRMMPDGWDGTPPTLGNGECEMVTSGTPCEGNTDKACTACGAYNIGEFYDGQSHRAVPKFCPNCGRPVKGGL